ncbi:MAG: insulinase family protein, partial [bacterium]
MKKRYINFTLIFFCLASAFCKPQPKWNEPLKQNTKLTVGVLPNGMRYFIYPTDTQPGKISVRLLVNAGAAMETDSEDGLAHFIEHMAFNGTEHFKPGTLIHWFKDNGMGFG